MTALGTVDRQPWEQKFFKLLEKYHWILGRRFTKEKEKQKLGKDLVLVSFPLLLLESPAGPLLNPVLRVPNGSPSHGVALFQTLPLRKPVIIGGSSPRDA